LRERDGGFVNKSVDISEINFHNQNFWWYFFSSNFRHAFIEDEGLFLAGILAQYEPDGVLEWGHTFTQYYDGVIYESDGYLDNPTTLEAKISSDETWKIEFHPGDTIYFINDVEIGCTGPHWKRQVLPYSKIRSVLSQKDGIILFLLFLPMVYATADEIDEARENIIEILPMIFPKEICEQLTRCILEFISLNMQIKSVNNGYDNSNKRRF